MLETSPIPNPPAPRKRDRLATEERLLRAAKLVFSRLGFQGATTKLIARESGVNESLIARYFNGKTGLLFAILRDHIETSLATALPYPPQPTLESELRRYAEFVVGKYRCAVSTLKILVTQSLVDEAFNEKMRGLLPKTINQELGERLNALLLEGKIQGGSEIRRVVEGLETQIFGYFLLRVIILGESPEATGPNIDRFAADCASLLSGSPAEMNRGS